MGIPENHPAILDALKKGLILPPPGAAAPEPEADAGLVAPSWSWLSADGVTTDAVEFVLPVRTASEANGREWRARSRRTHAARLAVSRAFGLRLRAVLPLAEHYHQGGPLDVVLTRLGGRRLDALSNLGAALKATEDAVALMLGADDGDPRWRARAEQEPGGPAGVRVRISKGV